MFKKTDIKIKIIGNVDFPEYKSKGAAGFDVQAHRIVKVFDGTKEASEDTVKTLQEKFKAQGHINLRPFERVLFGTGIQVAFIKPDYELQVRSRSGVAVKRGLVVSNSPGTIDSDYRGEIMVSITNTTKYLNAVQYNERIAQIVYQAADQVPITKAETILETERGEGGFGSTGK
jgi:dUTP pyrophosphatase